jgi:hypothetical protein
VCVAVRVAVCVAMFVDHCDCGSLCVSVTAHCVSLCLCVAAGGMGHCAGSLRASVGVKGHVHGSATVRGCLWATGVSGPLWVFKGHCAVSVHV